MIITTRNKKLWQDALFANDVLCISFILMYNRLYQNLCTMSQGRKNIIKSCDEKSQVANKKWLISHWWLRDRECYHAFLKNIYFYLLFKPYEVSSLHMVPLAQNLGPGSWTISGSNMWRKTLVHAFKWRGNEFRRVAAKTPE